MRRRFVLGLALGLALAACGGGEDPAALSDAIADVMMENVGEGTPFEREQAECFGDEVVETVGVERLVDIGLSVETIENGASPGSVDLTDDDVAKMTAAVTECIDFGRLVVDGLTAEVALSDESAGCLADGLNETDFVGAIAESALLGDDFSSELEAEMTAVLVGLLEDCLTADELRGSAGE